MTLHRETRTTEHKRGRTLSRTGLPLFLFATVLGFVSCYYPAQYHVVARPMPENTVIARAPSTQVYFYPKAGQTAMQQDRDRYECFNWAVSQTGFDPSLPSIPPRQRVAVVPVPAPGHDTAVGAVAGAAVGALAAGPRHAVGGALIGAGAGAVAGAVSDSARQASARQLEDAYARQDQARDFQLERRALEFRRAMSACLEGRGYTVK